MNAQMRPLRRRAAGLRLATLLVACALAPCIAAAQTSRTALEKPSGDVAISWWVVGSGGATPGPTGDVSATAGQTAITEVGTGGRPTAQLGFWLPESSPFDERQPIVTGGAGALALRSWPNPFRDETSLAFTLAHETHVRVTIHDMVGATVRTLVDGEQGAGERLVRWDGTDDAGRPVGSGAYIYIVETADATERGIVDRIR